MTKTRIVRSNCLLLRPSSPRRTTKRRDAYLLPEKTVFSQYLGSVRRGFDLTGFRWGRGGGLASPFMLWIEHRAVYTLVWHSAPQPHSRLFHFEMVFCHTTGLELALSLPQPPKCWDARCIPMPRPTPSLNQAPSKSGLSTSGLAQIYDHSPSYSGRAVARPYPSHPHHTGTLSGWLSTCSV